MLKFVFAIFLIAAFPALAQQAAGQSDYDAEAQRVARRTGVPVDSLPKSTDIKKMSIEEAVARDVEEQEKSRHPEDSLLQHFFNWALLLAVLGGCVYLGALFEPWRKVPIIIARADTRAKRIALLIFPFFATITLYRWHEDLDHYSWEPSLSFFIFFLASALCLLLAFTKLLNWINQK